MPIARLFVEAEPVSLARYAQRRLHRNALLADVVYADAVSAHLDAPSSISPALETKPAHPPSQVPPKAAPDSRVRSRPTPSSIRNSSTLEQETWRTNAVAKSNCMQRRRTHGEKRNRRAAVVRPSKRMPVFVPTHCVAQRCASAIKDAAASIAGPGEEMGPTVTQKMARADPSNPSTPTQCSSERP